MATTAAALKTSKEEEARPPALVLEVGLLVEPLFPPFPPFPPVEPPLGGATPGAVPEPVGTAPPGAPPVAVGRAPEMAVGAPEATGAPTGGLQAEPSAIWY